MLICCQCRRSLNKVCSCCRRVVDANELKKNVEENGLSYHFNPRSRCPDFVQVFLLEILSCPKCFLNIIIATLEQHGRAKRAHWPCCCHQDHQEPQGHLLRATGKPWSGREDSHTITHDMSNELQFCLYFPCNRRRRGPLHWHVCPQRV